MNHETEERIEQIALESGERTARELRKMVLAEFHKLDNEQRGELTLEQLHFVLMCAAEELAQPTEN